MRTNKFWLTWSEWHFIFLQILIDCGWHWKKNKFWYNENLVASGRSYILHMYVYVCVHIHTYILHVCVHVVCVYTYIHIHVHTCLARGVYDTNRYINNLLHVEHVSSISMHAKGNVVFLRFGPCERTRYQRYHLVVVVETCQFNTVESAVHQRVTIIPVHPYTPSKKWKWKVFLAKTGYNLEQKTATVCTHSYMNVPVHIYFLCTHVCSMLSCMSFAKNHILGRCMPDQNNGFVVCRGTIMLLCFKIWEFRRSRDASSPEL